MTPPLTLSNKAEELIPLLDALSAADRIGLACYLEMSLEEESDGSTEEEIREAWAAEMMRRMAEVESGEDPGIPAEEVHRLARESLS